MDFKRMDFGGKMILASIILAILSLFFPWVDIGFLSENGFGQDAYLFLILFIYPAVQVFRGGQVNKATGFICAILAVVLSIWYISEKNTDFIDAAGTGPYVFLVSAVLLAIGVWKQRA